MSSDILMIFLKPFVLGNVKTRLAKDIGGDQALEVYKRLVTHTVSEAEKLPEGIAIWFFYSEHPDNQTNFPGHYNLKIQHGESLGDRMANAIAWADEQGFEKKVIIGSDCAALSVRHLTDAFQMLDQHDVVIGPAADGGYYLIGTKQPQPALFANIAWSTDAVYADTLKIANEKTLSVGKLEVLSDIDDLDDLNAAPPFLRKSVN